MVSTALSEDKLTSLEEEAGKADFAGLLEMTLAQLAKPIDASLGDIESAWAWKSAGEAGDWVAARLAEETAKAGRKPAGKTSIAAKRYAPAEVLEKLRPSKPADGKMYAWKPASDEPGGRELGNLVHELMQGLGWDIDAFVDGLATAQIAPENVGLKDAAIGLIKECLAKPAVRQLLSEAPQGATLWLERKAALIHEGKLISAVFDRVHVIPGQSATVIDYKTNDCSLEHLKELYQGQMDLYRIAVAKLCGLSPDKIRCVLIHVRKGELVEC
jgi:ATP-dependent exoDNAse (exonuclease V) beta subunit